MRMIQETGEIPEDVHEDVRDALEEKFNTDMDGDGIVGSPKE
jgi:phospholipid/cholesterol/gamma-HCH transport system ATP-binding protein